MIIIFFPLKKWCFEMTSFYRLAENTLFSKIAPCMGVMPFTLVSFSRTWRTAAPKGIDGKEEWEARTE